MNKKLGVATALLVLVLLGVATALLVSTTGEEPRQMTTEQEQYTQKLQYAESVVSSLASPRLLAKDRVRADQSLTFLAEPATHDAIVSGVIDPLKALLKLLDSSPAEADQVAAGHFREALAQFEGWHRALVKSGVPIMEGVAEGAQAWSDGVLALTENPPSGITFSDYRIISAHLEVKRGED